MLIEQAIATWQIWRKPIHNEVPSKERMYEKLRQILWGREISQGKPIFITGFMGTGKSSIGAQLSKLLKLDFFDTDRLIEEKCGKSLPELFKEQGEEGFRKIETQIVLETLRKKNCIVSLGGGALNSPHNLRTVKEASILIYLDTSIETLAPRIFRNSVNRPAFHGLTYSETQNKVKQLLELRLPHYLQAHLHIKTDQLTSSQVAEIIYSKLWDQSL